MTKILVLFLVLSPNLFGAWAYCVRIMAGAATGSDQANFPLLVQLDSSNVGVTVKTVGNGGAIQNTVTQSGGQAITMPADLVFYSDSGCSTTKLAWEIDSYDGTGGTLRAHVVVANLTTATRALLYVGYGDAAINTQQNTSTFAPSAVWDSTFLNVHHLGIVTSAVDSTSNGINGTAANTPSATTGKINGAASFTLGNNSYFLGGGGGYIASWTTFTFSCWFNQTAADASGSTLFFSSNGTTGWAVQVSSNVLLTERGVANNNFTTLTVTPGKTYFLTLTRSGTTAIAYLYNYTDSTSATETITINNTAFPGDGNYYIARVDLANFAFGGWIDELRVSTSVRSANWIATEYANSSAPLTFNAVGNTPASKLAGPTRLVGPSKLSYTVAGALSWASLTNGQWTGLTNGQWTAMGN